jgi:hypothetical protein
MALVPIDWNPTPRHLRQFALAGASCLLAMAVLGASRRGWSPGPVCLAALATALGLAGVLRPLWVRTPYRVSMAVTFPIGWVVSHVILAAIYYGVFTAVALVFRLIRRDALQRRLEPSAATYWQPKGRTDDLRRYFRQY